jgi:hypothetical protein
MVSGIYHRGKKEGISYTCRVYKTDHKEHTQDCPAYDKTMEEDIIAFMSSDILSNFQPM